MAKSKMFVSMLAFLIGLTFGIVTAVHAEEEDSAASKSQEALSAQESQQEMGKTEEGMDIEAQSRASKPSLSEEGQTDQPSEPETKAEGD